MYSQTLGHLWTSYLLTIQPLYHRDASIPLKFPSCTDGFLAAIALLTVANLLLPVRIVVVSRAQFYLQLKTKDCSNLCVSYFTISLTVLMLFEFCLQNNVCVDKTCNTVLKNNSWLVDFRIYFKNRCKITMYIELFNLVGKMFIFEFCLPHLTWTVQFSWAA